MVWIGKTESGPTACQAAPTFGQEVMLLLSRVRPAVDMDRRRAKRKPLPVLFELSPHPSEVAYDTAEPTVVVGKDISERGIAFYHNRPIPYRRGLLSVELPGDGMVQVEVELLWCRSNRLGWYESGGRLLRVLSGSDSVARAG